VKVKFQIGIYFKTLLKAKRRISFKGSFCLVKGKAFETGGEISNLENASCNLSGTVIRGTPNTPKHGW
jgi:hypothetical protein